MFLAVKFLSGTSNTWTGCRIKCSLLWWVEVTSSTCWKFLKGCSVSPSVEDNERVQARKGHGREYNNGEQEESCFFPVEQWKGDGRYKNPDGILVDWSTGSRMVIHWQGGVEAWIILTLAQNYVKDLNLSSGGGRGSSPNPAVVFCWFLKFL